MTAGRHRLHPEREDPLTRPHLGLVEASPLRYLLSTPAGGGGERPVLCFLHGYDEGAPTEVHRALTRHGPLRPQSSPRATEEFIVVAPQLPTRGDLWRGYAEEVRQIVETVRQAHGGDPRRTYLTGFSFGGNGVFDLALLQPEFWAALWPVDPTRVPPRDPQRPVWLSVGEITRHQTKAFVARLALRADADPDDERVCLDQGADHVGSATLAYRDERIYAWLLSKRLDPA